MQGDHSLVPGPLHRSTEPKLTLPVELPGWVLNSKTVGLFNHAFFHKQIKARVEILQDYEPFFYPLDIVLHWNRMYGKRGLLQFQFALPWESAREGTIAVLREVSKSGLASFLAVLKVFGDVASPGLMSFPKPGITLALDFPIKTGQQLRPFRPARGHDRRFWGPFVSSKGRTHDRRAVSGLLSPVGALRPL